MALFNLLKCPMCAKHIDEDALVCPYCRSDIPQYSRDEISEVRAKSDAIIGKVGVGCQAVIAIVMIILAIAIFVT